MKIVCEKKSLLAYLEVISIPKKETEPVVTIEARDNQEVCVMVTHPTFTFSFLGDHVQVNQSGTTTVTLSSIKKALGKTKAKYPVIIEATCVLQDDGTQTHDYPMEAATMIPRLPSATPSLVDISGDKLASILAPLSVFSTRDKLYPWRQEVVVEKNDTGIQFTQCNGVHLTKVLCAGAFPTSEFGRKTVSADIFGTVAKMLAFFPKARYEEAGDIIGFYEGPDKELLLKLQPTQAPSFDVPPLSTSAQLHLNPIEQEGKKKAKPFESVLMEKMRAYRDEHLLEYPEIHLSFEVEPDNETGYLVHAILSEGTGRHRTHVLSTTSPLFSGSIPTLNLPGYDVIKALGSLPEITSLKLTERGLLLETVQFEDGVRQATVFLHGRTPLKKEDVHA